MPLLLGIIGLIAGGVTGVIGGVLNIFSGVEESKETQADITSEVDYQSEKYKDDEQKLISDKEIALADAELSWEQQKKNAEESADNLRFTAKGEREQAHDFLYQAGMLREDALEYKAQSNQVGIKTTQDESALSTIYNQAIKNINLTEEQNQFSNQISQVNQGKSAGATIAGMAKTGVRAGASTYAAQQGEQTLFDEQLALTAKTQQAAQDNALINGNANLQSGIWTLNSQRNQQKQLQTQSDRAVAAAGRYDTKADLALESAGRYEKKAVNTLADYDAGGLATRQYENSLKGLNSDFEYKKTSMSRDFQRNMELLEDAYEDAQYGFWDGLTDYFNGAQVGQAAGQNTANFLKDFGSYLQ